MCDPLTMMAIAGGAIAGGGKLYEGLAGSSAHGISADLARGGAELLGKQADIAGGNVDLAVTRGNYDEFLTRRKGGQVLASERSHFAGNNVDASYGSPLAIEGYSAAQIETDAQLIRAKMMVERSDALTTVAKIRAAQAGQVFKASAEDTAATTSTISGILGAGASFLTAASKWPGLGEGKTTPSPGNSIGGQSAGDVNQFSSRFLAGGNVWGQ